MKKLTSALLILLSIASLSAEELKVTHTTKDPSKPFTSHYTTYFYFVDQPASNCTVHIQRDLFGNSKKLQITADPNNSLDTPFCVMSGQGFLPGEKVLVTIKSKNRSYTCSLFPHPVIKRSQKDLASVSAELNMINPTLYDLKLKDFQKGEKILFSSRSQHEEIKTEVILENGSVTIGHMPGVVGFPGGHNELQITRENGEKIDLKLPWGNALQPFAEYMEELPRT